MPRLSDLIEKRKFVKKEYRPWDLSGTGTVDSKNQDSEGNEQTKAKQENTSLTETAQNIEDIRKEPKLVKKGKNKTVSDNEIDNKLDNKTGNKEVTNREQLDNKQVTKNNKLDNNEITFREQTDNKKGNVLDNNIENKYHINYLIETIKKLSGIQKTIFLYVINICTSRGTYDTGHLLIRDVANAANCSIGSAKTSLFRLIEKRVVIRNQGKSSRGGHMILSINEDIQAASIQAQQALFNHQQIFKMDNVLGNDSGNKAPYSSSIYKNITTTMSEDWKKINFDLIEHIGFNESHLKQLYDCKTTTAEIIQDAIERFSYSLEHNEKVKSYPNPLNVFIGVLRKGQRWNEPNYVPAKELAMRQILEEKRKEKERLDAMVKELVDIEFPEWKRKLSKDEFNQIVPEEVRKVNLQAAINSSLKVYFTENIIYPKLNK